MEMAVPNMDVFEAYFKRAGLDGDGRISGAEASPCNNFTVVSLEILSNTHPLARADRLQSDLDEILKALTEQYKKHGLTVNSTAVIELPFGFSNELTVDVKSAPGQTDDSLTPDSLSNGDGRSGIFTSEHVLESESAYNHSEDEMARSPQCSRAGRSASESPSQDFSDVFTRSTEADIDTHSRSFDESIWGAFDTNDDVDPVWGFNHTGNKDSSENEKGFCGSDDFGLKPIRIQKNSIFFEESAASSPLSRFSNSPSITEGGFSPREKLKSSKDFGHSRAFSSFDDSDPFGSSGPFKVSSENQTPKKIGPLTPAGRRMAFHRVSMLKQLQVKFEAGS
ncbi:hypothetical protein SADUNF_Sadunf05G0193200 [Salix dunnii]|uniref:Calcium-binding EF hand family protein n=1 Tax=Salix dunnii TaxID=1413687 RepID=A0A835KC61_9ROSI|nr:hypothetical protein SADUNF_Sadunf05G0193200 [Salix dunnii]